MSYFQGIARPIVLSLLTLAGGCVETVHEQLDSSNPYAQLAGSEFSVTGEVRAYGIYGGDLRDRKLSYVTLIPGAGISGPEVAFKTPIPKGARLKILSAWRAKYLFDEEIYFVVDLGNGELPNGVPVHLVLSRGNEAENGLNPAVYAKVGT